MENIYSTGLRRIGASIVDGIVFWPFGLIIPLFVQLQMPQSILEMWSYVIAVLPVAYSIFCHYKYGMTIGKWVARIKVIDVSETRNITLRQAFLRDVFLVVMVIVDIIIYNLEKTYWQDGVYPEFVTWLSIVASSAWLIWTVAEIISMLSNSKRRAIHDFIAGTVVVRTDEFERVKLLRQSFDNPGGQ